MSGYFCLLHLRQSNIFTIIYNISFYNICNKLLYNDDFSYKYILYEHHTYFILFTISHQKSLESV